MHTSSAKYATRSQSKSSPTSVDATGDVEGGIPLTLLILKIECRKQREPAIKIYLPMGSTQQQRNFVLRAFMYLSPRSEACKDNFALARDNIDIAYDLEFSHNFSKDRPFIQRYAGHRAVWRFVRYLQKFKNEVWGEDHPGPKVFLAVEPRNEFYVIY